MPRPKTKTELLNLGEANFNKLVELIETTSEENRSREFPPGTMNRNMSDALMHLHHWHLMMLDWYIVGMSGAKPKMPADGYTWKTTPELNKWIWDKYKNTPIHEALAAVRDSYIDVRSKIEMHTNEELFTKKKYKWTGSTSLGSYLVSATSSHYDWAYKLIKKAMKSW